MVFFCRHHWISRSGMDDGSICSKCHAISARPVGSKGSLTGLATLCAAHLRKQKVEREQNHGPALFHPPKIHADSSSGASIMRGALSRQFCDEGQL